MQDKYIKLTLGISILLITIASIAYVILNQPDETSTTNPTETNLYEKVETLESIIMSGEDLKCDIQIVNGNKTQKAILYTSNKEGLIVSENSIGAIKIQLNAIYKDELIYAWTTTFGKSIGFKISQDNLVKIDHIQIPNEYKFVVEQFSGDLSSNCNEWKVDDTMFQLPQDINFK